MRTSSIRFFFIKPRVRWAFRNDQNSHFSESGIGELTLVVPAPQVGDPGILPKLPGFAEAR